MRVRTQLATRKRYKPVSIEEIYRRRPYEVPDMTEQQWDIFQRMNLQGLSSYVSTDKHFNPRKYDRKDVRRFMDNPTMYEKQLREISQFLLINSGAYLRLVGFFSSLMTLDTVLIPMAEADKLTTPAFQRAKKKVDKYLDSFNLKRELGKIMSIVMLEDVFFGMERESKDSIMIQRLPSDQCKITHLEDGMYGFCFDMSFFNGTNKSLLETEFPPQFIEMYAEYERSKEKWQEVDSNMGVCFKFHDNILQNVPPLAGTFEDLLYFDDSKAIDYAETLMGNYRLLLQKIPMADKAKSIKDMIFDAKEARVFHNLIKSTLPENIGIVTTPMEVTDIKLDKTSSEKEKDKVRRAEDNVFTSAGVSKALFNDEASNSITINKAIQVDAASLMKMLRQFEVFFKNRLRKFGTASYAFKLLFPDINIFNRDEKVDQYLKLGQYGLPKSFLFAAMGVSEYEAISLLQYESSIGLLDMMIPLQSSHVATGKEDAGRPQKDEDDLGEEGVKTRAGNKNDGKVE